jgi:hypothetical protein
MVDAGENKSQCIYMQLKFSLSRVVATETWRIRAETAHLERSVRFIHKIRNRGARMGVLRTLANSRTGTVSSRSQCTKKQTV